MSVHALYNVNVNNCWTLISFHFGSIECGHSICCESKRFPTDQSERRKENANQIYCTIYCICRFLENAIRLSPTGKFSVVLFLRQLSISEHVTSSFPCGSSLCCAKMPHEKLHKNHFRFCSRRDASPSLPIWQLYNVHTDTLFVSGKINSEISSSFIKLILLNVYGVRTVGTVCAMETLRHTHRQMGALFSMG